VKAGKRGVVLAALFTLGIVSSLVATGPAGAVTPTVLTSGTAVTNVAGAADTEALYQLDVPAGNDVLTFQMSGGTGDADLFVRFGDIPTIDTYDCRPYLDGNNETCTFNAPAAGTWYVMVHGFSDFAGITLKGTYQQMPDFSIDVAPNAGSTPANTSVTATVSTTAVSGTANIALSASGLPTGATATFSPATVKAGSSSTMTITTTAATPTDTYPITITGTAGPKTHSVGYSLTVVDDLVTPLATGVPVTGIAGATGSDQLWRFDLPSGNNVLIFATSGGTGDVDLYARRGALPTTLAYDCRSHTHGNNESCVIDNPVAGRWYVMVHGYADFTDVSLTASYMNITALQNKKAIKDSGAAGSSKLWKISVPTGQKKLDIKLSGGTGHADLYVSYAKIPTTTVSDCHPARVGTREECVFTAPKAGGYYVLLNGAAAYNTVQLVAKFA